MLPNKLFNYILFNPFDILKIIRYIPRIRDLSNEKK